MVNQKNVYIYDFRKSGSIKNNPEMKILITGIRGTIGRVLKKHLDKNGHTLFGWNREEVHPLDHEACQQYIDDVAPHIIYHLAIASFPRGYDNESWKINTEWPAQLSLICQQYKIPFVFSSSAMVFSDTKREAITRERKADAIWMENNSYGYEKKMAEEYIMENNPAATIFRLGWQIDPFSEGNNMISKLHQMQRESGILKLSTCWYPACSFLSDTIQYLGEMKNIKKGIFMLDSNKKWSMYEIACALKETYRFNWTIEPNEDYFYDQRMFDDQLIFPSLEERLNFLN
jgi:dTDP-4-dehydrorhamnose reductase